MARKSLNTQQQFDTEDFEFVKEGDCAEGYLLAVIDLVGKKPGKMFGKPFKKYVLRTDDGDVSFLGGTVIDKTLPNVALGTKVWVTYLGFNKNYKNYNIESDDEDTIGLNGTMSEPTTAADVIAQAKQTA